MSKKQGEQQPIPNDVIEREAVKCIIGLLPTNRVENFIKISSTEPCFDGYVNFYSDVSDKKRGMIQIPVQVKGTTLKYSTNYMSVDTDDLRNYIPNGVVYFVVKVKYDEKQTPLFHRVLGRAFIAEDIRKILRNRKKGSISLDFQELSSSDEFLDMFEAYRIKRMATTLSKEFDPSREDGSFSLRLLSPDNKFVCNPVLGEKYFGLLSNGEQSFYVHDLSFSEVVNGIGSAGCGGLTYFDNVQKTTDVTGNVVLILSTALSLFIPSGSRTKIIVSTNYDAHPSVVKKSLEFLNDAFSRGSFEINGTSFPISVPEANKKRQIEEMQNICRFIGIIETFHQSTGIPGYDRLSSYGNGSEYQQFVSLFSKLDEYVSFFTCKFSGKTYFIVRYISEQGPVFQNVFDPTLYDNCELTLLKGDIKVKTSPIIAIPDDTWKTIEETGDNSLRVIFEKYPIVRDNAREYEEMCDRLLNLYLNAGRAFFINIVEVVTSFLPDSIEKRLFDLGIKAIKKQTFSEYELSVCDGFEDKFIVHVLRGERYLAKKYERTSSCKWSFVRSLFRSI